MKEQIDTPTLIPTQTNSAVCELEQIYEMALDLCISRGVAYVDDCRKCRVHEDCLYQSMARGLYNAGYRKQSEWISVEDRLPEESKSYLCYGFWEDDCTHGIYIVLYYCCEWMSYSDFVITHWTPLPEPPEMKGGE